MAPLSHVRAPPHPAPTEHRASPERPQLTGRQPTAVCTLSAHNSVGTSSAKALRQMVTPAGQTLWAPHGKHGRVGSSLLVQLGSPSPGSVCYVGANGHQSGFPTRSPAGPRPSTHVHLHLPEQASGPQTACSWPVDGNMGWGLALLSVHLWARGPGPTPPTSTQGPGCRSAFEKVANGFSCCLET